MTSDRLYKTCDTQRLQLFSLCKRARKYSEFRVHLEIGVKKGVCHVPGLVWPEQTSQKKTPTNSSSLKFFSEFVPLFSEILVMLSMCYRFIRHISGNYHMAILLQMIIWLFIFHKYTFCIIMHFISNNMANNNHNQASVFKSVHGLKKTI